MVGTGMRFALSLSIAALSAALSGCASYNNFVNSNLRSVAAEDLVPGNGPGSGPGNVSLKDAIAAVANQSETKCADFLSSLVLAETAGDTSFDLLSTTTSALSTLFVPITTVHALSASTTVLLGSKAAIDSDFYAKASIANFATAIQSTYYTDMGKYVDALAVADPSTLDWQVEIYRISAIHRECALAQAEAAITKTLQSPPPTTVQPATVAAPVAPASVVPGHAIR
jgi:hypothetical protein